MTKCASCHTSELRPYLTNLTDLEYGTPWTGNIHICSSCSLIQQFPMPTEQEAIDFYPEEYVHYNPGRSALRQFLMKSFMRRTIKLLKKLGARPGMRILDIGCGGGEKLNILAQSLELKATGLEPNKYASEVCKDLYQFDILNSTFPSELIVPESFDFVRINHVIEHVPDPVEFVNQIKKVLRPGGHLIGETENLNCLSFKVFGRYWSFLHLPYHLLFFTNETLKKVFQKSDMKNVNITYGNDPAGWSLSLQNYLRRNIQDRSKLSSRMPGYLFLTILSVPISFLELFTGNGPVMIFTSRKEDAPK